MSKLRILLAILVVMAGVAGYLIGVSTRPPSHAATPRSVARASDEPSAAQPTIPLPISTPLATSAATDTLTGLRIDWERTQATAIDYEILAAPQIEEVTREFHLDFSEMKALEAAAADPLVYFRKLEPATGRAWIASRGRVERGEDPVMVANVERCAIRLTPIMPELATGQPWMEYRRLVPGQVVDVLPYFEERCIFSGRVVDQEGKPLAKAMLSLGCSWRLPAESDRATFESFTPRLRIDRDPEGGASIARFVKSARSDAEGRFSVALPFSGEVRIRAMMPQYESREFSFPSRGFLAGNDDVELSLQRREGPSATALSLRYDDGSPAKGLFLHIYSFGDDWFARELWVNSGDDGVVDLSILGPGQRAHARVYGPDSRINKSLRITTGEDAVVTLGPAPK